MKYSAKLLFTKMEFIGVGYGSNEYVEQAVTLLFNVVMVCGFALQQCIGVYLFI